MHTISSQGIDFFTVIVQSVPNTVYYGDISPLDFLPTDTLDLELYIILNIPSELYTPAPISLESSRSDYYV